MNIDYKTKQLKDNRMFNNIGKPLIDGKGAIAFFHNIL